MRLPGHHYLLFCRGSPIGCLAQLAWLLPIARSGETAVILFSTRGVINGPRSTDSARNWLLAVASLFVVVLNQPIAHKGEKAILVIGSRKSVSEAERKVLLLLSRPCRRVRSIRRQNGLGLPSLSPDDTAGLHQTGARSSSPTTKRTPGTALSPGQKPKSEKAGVMPILRFC